MRWKLAYLKLLNCLKRKASSDSDVERIKAGLETGFYNGIGSVLGKSFQLAQYNVFAGDPGFITTDIENIKKVTKEDVMHVYNKYIKDKPFIMTSFVPKGQLSLITENSTKAPVVEEKISENIAKTVESANEEISKKRLQILIVQWNLHKEHLLS